MPRSPLLRTAAVCLTLLALVASIWPAGASLAADFINHVVAPGEVLSIIAERYGARTDEIAALNGLRGTTIYAGQTLRIPATPGAEARGPATGAPGVHTVQLGEALSLIAERYKSSVRDLMAANGLTGTTIYAGQRLTIPRESGGGAGSGAGSTYLSYRVARGDALSTIAGRFGVGVRALMEANGLRSETIFAGQVLRVPAPSSWAATAAYTVRPGDALSMIAAAHGTSVATLQAANDLRGELIFAGQVLRVPVRGAQIATVQEGNAGGTSSGVGQPAGSQPDQPEGSQPRQPEGSQPEQPERSQPGQGEADGAPVNPAPRTDGHQTGTGDNPSQQRPAGLTGTPSSHPGVSEQAPGTAPADPENTSAHRVARGDTIWGLARSYGITETALMLANNLRNSLLYIGQVLTIPRRELEAGARPLLGRVIAVDPGHGAEIHGTSGVVTGNMEADVVLDISHRLAARLRSSGAVVVMTREGKGLPRDPFDRSANELEARVRIARRAGADFFVSIHNNWFRDPRESGVITFYRQGDDRAARIFQEELAQVTGMVNRGAEPADYYVLRNNASPAVLVEIGFMSNPGDDRLLNDPAFREKAADALHRALIRVFN